MGELALECEATRGVVGRRVRRAWARVLAAAALYGGVLGAGLATGWGWLVWVLAVGFLGMAVVIVGAGRELDAARRMRRVLRIYEWEETVARTGRGKDPRIGKYGSTVTGVQLRRGGGDGAWMPLMSVLSGKVEEVVPAEGEAAVWFAGDLRFGGVISRTGGGTPMLVRRQEFGTAGQRRMTGTPEEDDRARRAGLWAWQERAERGG